MSEWMRKDTDNIETYSAGMKQRIKLAQAVNARSTIVFLTNQRQVWIQRVGRKCLILSKIYHQSKNINIILSSHLLPDIEYTCQDVIVLREGKFVIKGNIEELKSTHRKMYEVRIKGDSDSFVSDLKSINVEFWEFERETISDYLT